MKEIWKDIKYYEGKYQISNLGQVKSLSRYSDSNYKTRQISERILKQIPTVYGYTKVNLIKNNVQTGAYVASLVWTHFKDDSMKGYISFKDENPKNNSIDNLIWSSHKKDKYCVPLKEFIPVGDRQQISTQKDSDILDILQRLYLIGGSSQKAHIEGALAAFKYIEDKDVSKLLKELL